MADNGTGVFNRIYTFAVDRLNGQKPAAERFDGEFDNFKAGMDNRICRDGQSTIIADIGFNNKRITGLGDATAATDALNRQSGDARYLQVSQAATAAEIRANTAEKVIDTDGIWAASAPVSLGTTLSGTVAVDLATGVNFTGTLTGSVTLSAPTNAKPGQAGFILLAQDATGGRTIAFSAEWKFEDRIAPLLTTTAGTSTYIGYSVVNSTFIVASVVRGL